MRKILTVSVLLLCLITAIFFVGCDQPEKKEITFDNVIEGGTNNPTNNTNPSTNNTDPQTNNADQQTNNADSQTKNTLAVYNYTGSFEGNGVAWIDAIDAADEELTFDHEYSDYYQSETINSVSYKGVTIENDYNKSSWLTYYANTGAPETADYTVDPFTFNEEDYYLTAVTLDKITVQPGFKVLFIQTVTSGVWGTDTYSSEVSTEKAILFNYVKKEDSTPKSTLAVYNYTGSFEGNGVAWIDAIDAADEELTFDHEYNDYYQSETINSVSYKGVTIENDYNKSSWLTYYANTGAPETADYTVDPFTFNGEDYYLTAVTLDKITVQPGFKVLFIQTVTSGVWGTDTYSSEVSTEKAILFNYVSAQ